MIKPTDHFAHKTPNHLTIRVRDEDVAVCLDAMAIAEGEVDVEGVGACRVVGHAVGIGTNDFTVITRAVAEPALGIWAGLVTVKQGDETKTYIDGKLETAQEKPDLKGPRPKRPA